MCHVNNCLVNKFQYKKIATRGTAIFLLKLQYLEDANGNFSWSSEQVFQFGVEFHKRE